MDDLLLLKLIRPTGRSWRSSGCTERQWQRWGMFFFRFFARSVGGFPKNRGFFHPKMDGEFSWENPYLKWDDLGGKPTIFGNIQVVATHIFF